ncbi:MAG: 2,3-bisphosphoglycerate-independent phosphoglycerate mutase, partial [archaeon]
MKTVFIILDGLGDRPIKEFAGKTPLEAAKKPNLNRLAKNGMTGMLYALAPGVNVGSDVAQLSIFGYQPEKYYSGRGPIECLGAGMEIKQNDICFRANISSIGEDKTIIDRRAERISSTKEFVEEFNGMEISGVKILVKPATGYRACIIFRGESLSDKVSTNDPKQNGKKALKALPLDGTKSAKKTADVLNEFLDISSKKLAQNKKNIELKRQGKLQANCLLVRGAGKAHNVPGFLEKYSLSAACIAGAGLYKGIGKMLGMKIIDAPGATGLPDTDIKAKVAHTIKALKEFDFVFLHLKATDSFGEDGNAPKKKWFIEKFDKELAPLL